MHALKQLFNRTPIPTLSPGEAQARLQSNARPIVLDVRQPYEYEAGHVRGARLVPLNRLAQEVASLPTDRPVLCICRSGSRSATATRQLVAAGFDCYNVQGGMLAWQRAGLPVESGRSA